MSSNTTWVWFFAFITMWAVLFAGEPDLMDAIIQSAMEEKTAAS